MREGCDRNGQGIRRCRSYGVAEIWDRRIHKHSAPPEPRSCIDTCRTPADQTPIVEPASNPGVAFPSGN